MNRSEARRGGVSMWLVVVGAIAGVTLLQLYRSFVQLTRFQAFAAVFVSMSAEALPFLLLGAVVSAAVERRFEARPSRVSAWAARLSPTGAAVAALGGLVVPVGAERAGALADQMRDAGLPLRPATAFAAGAGTLNLVTVVAMFAAFSNRPAIIAFRLLVALAVAIGGALLWRRERGKREVRPVHPEPRADARAPGAGERILALAQRTSDHFVGSVRYFAVAALAVALLQTALPVWWSIALRNNLPAALAVSMLMAFVFAVGGAGDAFIGKAMSVFMPPSAVLVFLVLAPILNINTIGEWTARVGGMRAVGWALSVLAIVMATAIGFDLWSTGGVL